MAGSSSRCWDSRPCPGRCARRPAASLTDPLCIGDVQFAPTDLHRHLTHALTEAAEGRLRPAIGEVFPLERAGDAHAAVEGRGVVGKVVLKA